METCVICIESMEKEIAILDCNHAYHFDCLTKYQETLKSWVIKCPLCRRNSTVIDICDYFMIDNEIIRLGTEKFGERKKKTCVIL